MLSCHLWGAVGGGRRNSFSILSRKIKLSRAGWSWLRLFFKKTKQKKQTDTGKAQSERNLSRNCKYVKRWCGEHQHLGFLNCKNRNNKGRVLFNYTVITHFLHESSISHYFSPSFVLFIYYKTWNARKWDILNTMLIATNTFMFGKSVKAPEQKVRLQMKRKKKTTT